MSGIVGVDRESMVLDVLPGTFGTWLEDTLRGRARRDRRPLAPVDRPLDRRRLARVPRRRADEHALRQDRGHGRRPRRRARRRPRRSHRRLRRAPRSAPTSPSCSSAPRARSASSPAPGSGSTRRPPTDRRAAYAFPALRRRARRVPADPPPGRPARGAPPLRRDRGATARSRPAPTATCCSCSTRATRSIVDATLGDRGRGVRGRGARSTSGSSSSGSSTATTSSALQALIRPRLRGRHDGDLGAVVAVRTRSTRPRPPRSAPCPARSWRARTRATATPTARASTSRSRASRPRGAKDAFYRAAWDAGTRAVLAHGGALSHHHGVGLNRSRFVRDALGPAFDVLVATKQALDPNGILNPGKLGLPDPWADPEPGHEPRRLD